MEWHNWMELLLLLLREMRKGLMSVPRLSGAGWAMLWTLLILPLLRMSFRVLL